MVDDDGAPQQDDMGGAGLFLVRLGESDADFAVCQRVGTVAGSRLLPDSQQTVAQLVADQALQAAAVPKEVSDAFRGRAFLAQSGENNLGPNH